jgi:hypothetical protein
VWALLLCLACAGAPDPAPAPAPAPAHGVEIYPTVAALPANALQLTVLLDEPLGPGALRFRLNGASGEDGIARQAWRADAHALALSSSITIDLHPLAPGTEARFDVLDGDAVVASRSFVVTEADLEAPDGAQVTAVAAGGVLRLGFPEPMSRATLDALAVLQDGAPIGGSWQLDAPQRVATFEPASAVSDAPLFLAIGVGAQDLAGNPLAHRPVGPMPVNQASSGG